MRFSEAALAQFLGDSLRSPQWSIVSEHGMLTCATYSVACCAVLQALGPDWAQKHIGRSAKACDYFKAKKDDQQELLRYMSRATEFGELIYNLYDIEGFDERINTIRANDTSGVESGIAELIAGKFFKLTGVDFRYVVTKVEPGQNTPKNPDIDYVAGDNRPESCEVKCNLESTDLNDRSIINILKSAKSQLPKGKAGIILLRVPENWLADMAAGTAVIGQAIEAFIAREKTTRVSSVYVFVSETRFLPNDHMANVFRVKEFRNRYCDMPSGITIPDLTCGLPNWRSLQSLAHRELHAARLRA
jgi:hypothetical protein